MPIPPELLAAYRAALYVVFGDPEVVLRVGAHDAAVDRWLERSGARGGAYLTAANPGSMLALRGNGRRGWFGWPTDERIEELREAWFDAADITAQKTIAEHIQRRFFESVPFLPLGRMRQPMAFRSDIQDVVSSSFALSWGVRRV